MAWGYPVSRFIDWQAMMGQGANRVFLTNKRRCQARCKLIYFPENRNSDSYPYQKQTGADRAARFQV
jgi:hypothetical protein